MRKFSLVVLAGTVLVPAFLHAAEERKALVPEVHARVLSAPINEMSGIVKSRKRDDLYWVHNDSGDKARIFAINGQGQSILPTYSRFTRYGDAKEEGKQQWQGFEVLHAQNIDWEDIALDANYLYLADTGNNFNARQNLAIYAISEIDPTASTRSAVVQKWAVHYPEQQEFPPGNWHYDAESLFVADGELYLITKHRKTGRLSTFEPGARLYHLETRHTDRSNALRLVDSTALITAATGADLSPDGSTLAVISYDTLWLFDKPASGAAWLSSTHRSFLLDRSVTRQAEAVAWQDDDTLLITNEGRDMFRLHIPDLPSK